MNTMNENKFYDVTIKDLIALTLKKWRIILLIGFVIAILLGLYKFIPLYNNANTVEFENEKAELRQAIDAMQTEVDMKTKELDESIYYNLEPAMITKGLISFYIDTPIKDKDLGFQKNLVYSYESYFISGEICTKIANRLSEYIDPVYLKQVVKTQTNYSNEISFLNVYVMGSNNAQVNEIMQLLKQEVYNIQPEVSAKVAENTIHLITENITVVTDTQITTDKKTQEDLLRLLESQLNDKKSLLQPMQNIVSAVLKYGAIGFFVGLALSMLYFAAFIILSNNVKSRKQIIDNYELEVIGDFSPVIQQNKLDAFISKMAGEPCSISKDEMNLIIANNIIAMSKTKNIMIIGGRDVNNIQEIFNGISSCSILKEFKISCCYKSLGHSETLSSILNCGSVIVILKKNKTSLDELQNIISTINNYGKDFVGIILQ